MEYKRVKWRRMFYSTTLTIPAGTTEEDPVETELKIDYGVIHQVDIEFRSGTDFRAGVRIYHREYQLYPSNNDGEFVADGRAIIFTDHYEVKDEPGFLKIKGYAPTASYDHTVYIKIGVLPADVVTPLSSLGGSLKKFLQYVGVFR